MNWSFKKVPKLPQRGFCIPFEAYLVLDLTFLVSFLPFSLYEVKICLPRNLSVNCPPSLALPIPAKPPPCSDAKRHADPGESATPVGAKRRWCFNLFQNVSF